MRSICFALLLALSTTSCSHYSAPKRQERAYANYMKKMRHDRDKRLAKARRTMGKPSQQVPPELQPVETAQMSEGPMAVPRESESQ